MKKLLIALAAAFSAAATLEAAQAEFSYQGVLKDLNNVAMTGNKTVELRLYNRATGGSALWGRKYSVLLDSNGLFNIEVSDSLGSQISGISGVLANVLAANESLYIGLTIQGTSGEIVPRQKLLPVPFAAVAADVSRASGNFTVAGTLLATNGTFSGVLTARDVTANSLTAESTLTASGSAHVTGDLTVSGLITGFGIAPIGSIIMWSGSENNIPSGWALCNGQTVSGRTTPDLRDRFIVGAGGNYAVGATGGVNQVTLTLNQIPSHSHKYVFTGADVEGSYKKSNFFYNQDKHYSSLVNTNETLSTGGDTNGNTVPHETRPPYYALCFIMRTS